MNIFAELKPRIDNFKATREYVISSAVLPPSDVALSFGAPPFAIDDGTDYYAVIDKDGGVSPLPFGYQVANDHIEEEGCDAVFSTLMASSVGGANPVRYVPLVEGFEVPGDRAFRLETACESEIFEAVGTLVDLIQGMVTEKALFNFNQRLSNAIVRICESCEELESVDQAIAALAMQSSVLPILFLRSVQHALDELEEEMGAEEDE